ncbi:MAG: hypothetical protein K0S38_1032 [Candidatus Paceibacter sp.]|jgi:hypothetical protein|nr:hypothetical protein [Candidatus Paceibacter sp.]
MSDSIQFDEGQDPNAVPTFGSTRLAEVETTPPLVRLVQKWHLAKSDTQAYFVLIGMSLTLFILAAAIFAFAVLDIGKSNKPKYQITPGIRADLKTGLERSFNTIEKN